ncbi:hypothetical protein K7X08_037044 [Anisodus acutangulus]|uniref:Secreted protein n=1 Tax=Anisodus acutangulus TaxID=402998 RepID=A0A9Q1L7G3_9SOLA|nr:hypothetical protein K7X08_037044 [Anisodus acutangulus]
MLLLVGLLSLTSGRGVLSVAVMFNLVKVAKLSIAGVVPVSATGVEEKFIITGVVVILPQHGSSTVLYFLFVS